MISQQQLSDSSPDLPGWQMPARQIHLYFSYPEQISDPALLHGYESLLSTDERARMARFHFARNRHQYLVTRALIRTSLSAHCPVDPGAWRFSTNRYGKPEISHPDTAPPLRFNLSHTYGLTVCAITRDYAIGVDVEDAQRTSQSGFSHLASYFSAREVEDLCNLPADQQQQRFFDYWTLKESYIKARGEGLAIPLGKFSFLFAGNKLKQFRVEPDLQDDPDCWQFWRMAIADQDNADQCGADQYRPDQYRIALAIKSENSDHKVTAFHSVPLQSNVPLALSFLS